MKRFWDKVQITDDCWLWQAYVQPNGYGKFASGSRILYAHRFAYELAVGPIPKGMQIDHLCRVRHCVRPDHLELVTSGENTRRGLLGFGLSGLCRAGIHDMADPGNVYVARSGGRWCRLCAREGQRRYRQRQRVTS
jgi:hypothetical protein